MTEQLRSALDNSLWQNHKIGDEYFIVNKDGSKDAGWKIAYYPLLEDGKTNHPYKEPRALVEKPIPGGIDFKEVAVRYLGKTNLASP